MGRRSFAQMSLVTLLPRPPVVEPLPSNPGDRSTDSWAQRFVRSGDRLRDRQPSELCAVSS